MEIVIGRKYRAKASFCHRFNEGEIVKLVKDGFLEDSGTEGQFGHFISTEREMGDQVLEYSTEVEEIE